MKMKVIQLIQNHHLIEVKEKLIKIILIKVNNILLIKKI